jgi:hypothetical protein
MSDAQSLQLSLGDVEFGFSLAKMRDLNLIQVMCKQCLFSLGHINLPEQNNTLSLLASPIFPPNFGPV